MGNLTSATRSIRPRRAALPALALALAMTLGACGVIAENDDANRSSAAPAPVQPEPTPTRTPAPNPTPGKGPACAELRCTSIMVTGDMLVHTQLWQQARADAAAAGLPGYTFVPLLEGQRRYVRNSDLAICHQETPVATPEGPFSAYPSFNVPPQIVTASKDIGYQACTTASNHTIDRGTEGLLRTLDALDAAGLKHTGSYRTEAASKEILMLQTESAKVAVIEGTYGHNGQIPEYPWLVDELDPATMIAKATQAKALGADIVLGVMHAGEEYASEPNAQQQEVAHALVDSGQFTMIYGHHTHSVLPIENYKGTWIVYGLGNGITELSPWYVVNNEGLLVRAQFSQNAAGTWTASDLAWAPSVIVRDPYRWCSVASDAPQGVCATPAADAETRQRTQSVVESMGAATAGAHELLITKEK
ncbi:hypothetical protein PJL15_00157 [Paenarthrobacter nitroguajacolicus]|nr:hypothetical protein [Paenarthrobacter nitroguajacolicus]